MRKCLTALIAILVAMVGVLGGVASTTAQSKGDIVIGLQCDRTGPTQIVGTVLCPAFHDYIALIIFFLIVEPEGLNRLWRNIRSYFRVWPFAY